MHIFIMHVIFPQKQWGSTYNEKSVRLVFSRTSAEKFIDMTKCLLFVATQNVSRSENNNNQRTERNIFSTS